MRYPIVFWDSGGTIFLSGNRPPNFGGCPTPAEVAETRTFRAECALQMFGYEVPGDLGEVIEHLDQELRLANDLSYSVEVLANGVFAHLGIEGRKEEALFLADALNGPRYRAWLWEGVVGALESLHEAGVLMGVIADTHLTGRMMRRVLTGVGLAGFFGPIICSCDLGVQKPNGRVFETALNALPGNHSTDTPVLYVGDNVVKDIGGATAFGWDAALHLTGNTQASDKAVLTFEDYNDLVKLVLE
ncbi:MAG: HAD family hydrolase [Candidatus Latescibacteria bacterium]|jgi:HAD superfamily hydrolase (TIGR01549 family)|nr:HAD family hydrolase [Candidatus Latescibacterota bacterium]